MTTYIGIDPGLSGAVAAIWPTGVAEVWDTPVATVKATRRDYMGTLMAGVVGSLKVSAGDVYAVLEQGIAMPRESSSTTYLCGRGGGLWEGILAALGIPYELVPPQRWKRAMGIPPGADKGASRAVAQRLFPHLAKQLARVKDDGRAEALLMAEYRRRLG